jgi:hypothetical protein
MLSKLYIEHQKLKLLESNSKLTKTNQKYSTNTEITTTKQKLLPTKHQRKQKKRLGLLKHQNKHAIQNNQDNFYNRNGDEDRSRLNLRARYESEV